MPTVAASLAHKLWPWQLPARPGFRSHLARSVPEQSHVQRCHAYASGKTTFSCPCVNTWKWTSLFWKKWILCTKDNQTGDFPSTSRLASIKILPRCLRKEMKRYWPFIVVTMENNVNSICQNEKHMFVSDFFPLSSFLTPQVKTDPVYTILALSPWQKYREVLPLNELTPNVFSIV